jgi:hypothetical protein
MPEGYSFIPEDDSFPEIDAPEVYDDVVNTPGGAAYRANVHEVGKESPWPSVDSVEIRLDDIYLRYRDHIETGVGGSRNNIFFARQVDGFFEGEPGEIIELYADFDGVPPGIELSQYLSAGMLGVLATVLVIEIAPDTAPGQYELGIGIKVGGRDYGTVPCVIEVAAAD